MKEFYNKDMISHLIMMDGDVLNIIGIMSEELAYMFRKFNPVERMIMSRDSGLINSYFSLTKNQLIDLEGFATTEHDIHDLDFLNEEFDPVIK